MKNRNYTKILKELFRVTSIEFKSNEINRSLKFSTTTFFIGRLNLLETIKNFSVNVNLT